MAAIYKADESFDRSLFAGASAAFGVFDGLHSGHRFLIDEAIRTAHESHTQSMVITFDIDPDEVFHPNRLRKLMNNEDRIAALARSGVDTVVVLPFTHDFYTLGPLEFLDATFTGHMLSHLHIGTNFHFGARAAGSVDTLRTWANDSAMCVHAHTLLAADGAPISATRIRTLLSEGNIVEANKLLGYRYFVRETVHHGRGEGADMGFQTANLVIPVARQVLGEGVYAGYACVGDTRYRAAISMGVSPVFRDTATATSEVHILNFSGDIYGQDIKVEFAEYLRPMIKFDSTEELIKTVMGNIRWVRENLPL